MWEHVPKFKFECWKLQGKFWMFHFEALGGARSRGGRGGGPLALGPWPFFWSRSTIQCIAQKRNQNCGTKRNDFQTANQVLFQRPQMQRIHPACGWLWWENKREHINASKRWKGFRLPLGQVNVDNRQWLHALLLLLFCSLSSKELRIAYLILAPTLSCEVV